MYYNIDMECYLIIYSDEFTLFFYLPGSFPLAKASESSW